MRGDSIAIAGGGPVGLLAALAFGLDGLPVTVFEAADEPSAAPRAMVYLHPLLPDLDRLGILDDMKARGHVDHEGFNMHVTVLGEVLSAPSTVLEGLVPHPYNVHLGQGDVCQTVLEHLSRLPNVDVRFGQQVTGLDQDGTGITLAIDGRSRSGPSRRSGHAAGWLIGADGGRSTVRELIGATAEGMTWGERFVATNVYTDFRSRGMRSSNMYVHPALGAVIAEIDGRGRWRCTFQEDASLPVETIRERIDAYFRALLGPGAEYGLDAYTPYRMHQRLSTKLRAGRVLLAGDAAHLTNPTGGLGLTSGIYDIIALHEGLTALIGGEAGESVLDRYAADRSRAFDDIASPTASHLKNIVYGSHDAATLRQLTQPIREGTKDVESQRAMLHGLDAMRSPSLLAEPLAGNPAGQGGPGRTAGPGGQSGLSNFA
jgi:3-(3-hydroxy-phenyl)propionate hydroxylase/6-hydroxy-3-succinoylpyridine 3-monooxygenase